MTTLTRSPHGLDSGGAETFWQARAACAGRHVLFDSDRWTDHQRAAHLCVRHCPVLAQCTTAAKAGPRWYGVLAGMVAGWRTPPDPGCGTWCVDRRIS